MTARAEPAKTAAIILAAGGSSRMGQPKQSLLFEGESLLRRAAVATIDAVLRPVLVVTGANADVSRRELIGLEVTEVFNPDWESGMGTSVSAGIRQLIHLEPRIEAAVLLLCDQPFVTAEIISRLVLTHRESGRPIVASQYGGNFGAPALFANALFPELLQLDGIEGAKQVIKRHKSRTEFVPFPRGEVDIDTPADYESVIGS